MIHRPKRHAPQYIGDVVVRDSLLGRGSSHAPGPVCGTQKHGPAHLSYPISTRLACQHPRHFTLPYTLSSGLGHRRVHVGTVPRVQLHRSLALGFHACGAIACGSALRAAYWGQPRHVSAQLLPSYPNHYQSFGPLPSPSRQTRQQHHSTSPNAGRRTRCCPRRLVNKR